MPDGAGPRAVSVGPVAARKLRTGARGRVGAVFARSLYLVLDETWVCIGPRELGDGPLNLLCEPAPEASAVAPDEPATIAGGRLRFGRAPAIDLTAAAPWHPPAIEPVERRRLAAGLAALRAALPEELPAEGLAPLLGGPPAPAGNAPVAEAARAAMRHLQDAVRSGAAGREDDHARLGDLLGLGPGLTPSGDDFLGGALVALALGGLHPLRDAIWAALAPRLSADTTALSAAHLAAAAEGFGSAALHELLRAIVAGDAAAMPERLSAVAAIGHSSGWDALAGAAAVLAALADTGDRRTANAQAAAGRL